MTGSLFDPQCSPPPPTPTYRLRPYQVEAHRSIMEAFSEHRSVLACMATALGKTVVFGHVAREFLPRGRVAVMVHRDELLQQAGSKLGPICEQKYDIEKGDQWANLEQPEPILLTSVQTLNAPWNGGLRMERFDPKDFSMLIADEAHHAACKTWRRAIEHFQRNPELRTLGVTATPNRSDEKAIGKIFEYCAFNYELRAALPHGWLVQPESMTGILEDLHLEQIKTVAGDFAKAELHEEMLRNKNLYGVAEETLKRVGKRRTLIFCVDVAQSEALCSILNSRREGCARHVDGQTPLRERHELLTEYARGEYQFLSQCMVCSEGFDDAGIECIVIARPTRSRLLLEQMIGRGTRTLPGTVDGIETAEERLAAIWNSAKPNLLILDFTGRLGELKLVHPIDILGGDYSDEVVQRAQTRIEERSERGEASDLMLELASMEHEIRDERRRNLQASIRARVTYTGKWIDPFDILDLAPTRERGWDHGRTLSQKQREMLERNRINPDELSYGDARAVLDKMSRFPELLPCTPGQARQLKRYGYDPAMNKRDAGQVMARLVAADWPPPRVWKEMRGDKNHAQR